MSLHSDDLDDERLIRYLRGECSPEEMRTIDRWAAENAVRRARLDLLRRGWMAAGSPVLRGDVEKGWTAIAAQLGEPAELSARREPPTRVLRVVPGAAARPRWAGAARAAAMLFGVGLAGLLVWATGRGSASRWARQAGAMREITTKPGQRADVYLSDGTHVVLGVASRLRFPARFGASRDVELRGRAYFDVAHEARPFDVRVAHAVVRDLGTKFDVQAYADSEHVVVAVTEGAVVLKPVMPAQEQGDSVILRRSDVGSVSPGGKLSVTVDADADAFAAWTNGKLVFQQTPAPEAVALLNRWYGADVRLGDTTLAGLAVTMSITDESLTDAIQILARAVDARIETHGSTVVLHARNTR